MFLISLGHHHHPALLHHHARITDHLLTFLVAFSTVILKPSFSQSLSVHSICPLPRLISWNLTTQCLAVTSVGSVGQCDTLSQPNWLAGAL